MLETSFFFYLHTFFFLLFFSPRTNPIIYIKVDRVFFLIDEKKISGSSILSFFSATVASSNFSVAHFFFFSKTGPSF